MNRLLVAAVLSTQCGPGGKNERQRPLDLEAESVWVAAGELVRGNDDPARDDEAPRHRVALRGFWMDRTLVTRRAYLAFADRTGYRTSAERAGFGIASNEGMEDWEWERVPGASFRRPFRPGTRRRSRRAARSLRAMRAFPPTARGLFDPVGNVWQ